MILDHPIYDWGRPDNALLRKAAHEFKTAVKEFCTTYFTHQPILEWVPNDEVFLDMTDEIKFRSSQKQSQFSIISEKDLENYYTQDQNDKVLIIDHQLERESSIPTPRPGQTCGCQEEFYLAGVLMKCLVNYLRAKNGIICSAGIGANRMLAKIAAGNYQCNCPYAGDVRVLYRTGFVRIAEQIPLKTLRPLGDLRDELQNAGYQTVEDIRFSSVEEIMNDVLDCDNATAMEIKKVANGFDETPVIHSLFSNGIKCKLTGKGPIYLGDLLENVKNLFEEFRERIEEEQTWNQRNPRVLRFIINPRNSAQISYSSDYNVVNLLAFPREVWSEIMSNLDLRFDRVSFNEMYFSTTLT